MKNCISYSIIFLFIIGMVACTSQPNESTEPMIDITKVDSIENNLKVLETELDDVLEGLE